MIDIDVIILLIVAPAEELGLPWIGLVTAGVGVATAVFNFLCSLCLIRGLVHLRSERHKLSQTRWHWIFLQVSICVFRSHLEDSWHALGLSWDMRGDIVKSRAPGEGAFRQ